MSLEELFSYERVGPRLGLMTAGWLYEGREADLRSICHSYFKHGHKTIPFVFAYRKAGMQEARLDAYRFACGLEFLLPTDRDTGEPCFAPWAEPQGHKAMAMRLIMEQGQLKRRKILTDLVALKDNSFFAPDPQASELYTDAWQPIKPAVTQRQLNNAPLNLGFTADRFAQHMEEQQDERVCITETAGACDFMLSEETGIMLTYLVRFHNQQLQHVELACIRIEQNREIYHGIELAFPGAICTGTILYDTEENGGFEASFDETGEFSGFTNRGMNPDYALAGIDPSKPVQYERSFLTALKQAEEGNSESFWKNNLLLQEKEEHG